MPITSDLQVLAFTLAPRSLTQLLTQPRRMSRPRPPCYLRPSFPFPLQPNKLHHGRSRQQHLDRAMGRFLPQAGLPVRKSRRQAEHRRWRTPRLLNPSRHHLNRRDNVFQVRFQQFRNPSADP